MKPTRSTIICTILVVLLLITGCYLSDPLNCFELGENYRRLTNPLWPNGFSSIVEQPATASVEDVLQKYYSVNRTKRFKIIETKRVWLMGNSAPTWAARVEADSQPETLLIHFEPAQGYWLVK